MYMCVLTYNFYKKVIKLHLLPALKLKNQNKNFYWFCYYANLTIYIILKAE